jgi:hypothetical protein
VAEKHDSTTVEWSVDHIECTVVLQCDWTYRNVLILDMLGFADAESMVDFAGDGSLIEDQGDLSGTLGDPSGFKPHAWPDLIDAVNFSTEGTIRIGRPPICYSASCKAVPGIGRTDTSGQGLDYTLAEITFKFTTQQELQLVSETIEFNSEFRQIEFSGLSWFDPKGSGPKGKFPGITQPEAPGKLLHSITYTKVLYRQPWIKQSLYWLPGAVNDRLLSADTLYMTATDPYVGTVNFGYNTINSGAQQSGSQLLQFQPETLLCLPAHLQRTTSVCGNQGYNITMKFAYKPNGWNKYWVARINGNTGGYSYMFPTTPKVTFATLDDAQRQVCIDANDSVTDLDGDGLYGESASYTYNPDSIVQNQAGKYVIPYRSYPIADFRDWIAGIVDDDLDAP